jgi:dihydroorotate dehydrogenase
MYQFLRKILFALDAEKAHLLAMRLISLGLVSSRAEALGKPSRIFGLPISHPVGLAAGFDKNAEAVDEWENLGFSFVEVGTITPRPQPGNSRPRLFRLPECRALINRMGFNNDGVEDIARRLERRETRIPVGANIGKNRDTPHEAAQIDYRTCAERLAGIADYLVVNVSSPNTPGLRDLQAADALKPILDAVVSAAKGTPVAVKLSPDLHEEDMGRACEIARECGARGVIATNTTVSREGTIGDHAGEAGGLSGAPLLPRAIQACKCARAALGGDQTLIGVGGIYAGADAKAMLEAGADAVQVYTSFVYRGPSVVRLLLSEMG